MSEKTTKEKSTFAVLSAVNVNGYVEQKNGLTYLSWAHAWRLLKENFPNSTFTIYENPQGFNYWTDGKTCWVKTGVTVEGVEHIEYLPVMDFRNQSIRLDKVTSMDVTKAIQRSLTKAAARHGLGLYIYAGEDLPFTEAEAAKAEQEELARQAAEERQTAINETQGCNTIEELQTLYNRHPALAEDRAFKSAINARAKQIKGE